MRHGDPAARGVQLHRVTRAAAQRGALPVLHLQQQHAPARAEDDEVGLACARADGQVVPDQVVVFQATPQLLQHAPFTGVAVSKDAQPGEMVSPNSAGGGFTRTGICTLVDMASLEIEVDVNENYINRVENGQPVKASREVRPGDRIPSDGEIVEGSSGIDESPVTGESVPKTRGPGDSVFAGSINTEAALRITVTKAASDNTIARIIRLVEEAEDDEALGDRGRHAAALEPFDGVARLPAVERPEQFAPAARIALREFTRLEAGVRDIAASTAGDFDLVAALLQLLLQKEHLNTSLA